MRGNIHGGKLKQKRICLGVQIAEEMHSKLIEIANKKELTMSDIVRMAIKEFVQKETA